MYEDRENDELVFFKTKKEFSSQPHDWYNHQPLYMFLNSIIYKQKMWEKMCPTSKNKGEKRKGENISGIPPKNEKI